MTDSTHQLTTIWIASQESDQNIRAFCFAIVAHVPYPDNLDTVSRVLAGPFPAVQELAGRYLLLASKGKDEEIRELFDDLRYRPWVHMPWVKEEIE